MAFIPRVVAAYVVLVGVLLTPARAEADLCPGDQWGIFIVDIDSIGGFDMAISAWSVISHSNSSHVQGCSGTHRVQVKLASFTPQSCSKTTSAAVDYNNASGLGHEAFSSEICEGQPGEQYTADAMSWWNDEDPCIDCYEESFDFVRIPDEDDDDYSPWGWGPFADCNDSNPGINPGVELYPGSFSCNYLSDLWGDINCNDQYDADDCGLSPIIIDLGGDGLRLTDAANGVDFDLNADGVAERLSWTSAGTDDAWLVLDRNGNGRIDNGQELFGNFTPQPDSPSLDGFKALGVLDTTGDGWISAADAAFSQLRLWTDANHDGISQASELRALSAAGVVRLSLDVKDSRRRDGHGNRFRYRAKIETASARDGGPFAYDVYLVGLPTRGVQASVVPKK